MAYSVSTITKYLKTLVESDMLLKNVEVEGEISNLSFPSSGHIYFRLKEGDVVISAIMYRSQATGLKERPSNGDKVIVKGKISVYGGGGYYQIVAGSIRRSGQGDLYRQFLELKEKLEAKGMFDPAYKRPIPKYINTLGVVTSPTGAAIRDIINVTRRRNPYVQIILSPAAVQGEEAPEAIARAIGLLDEMGTDVMIVGRGGGSAEDLWSFNDERVAEAIFATATPVIAAVGHETDVTIADFVADLRAPTPSAAAELAVYDLQEHLATLSAYKRTLRRFMDRKLEDRRQRAIDTEKRLLLLNPVRGIALKKQRAADLKKAMDKAIKSTLALNRHRLSSKASGLHALSPAARLAQGYSYLTDESGHNLSSISELKRDDLISARLSDGQVRARITEIIEAPGE